jgi:hypothetical protein
MVWIIVILLIVIVLLVKFSSSLNEDNSELGFQTLQEKFSVIVSVLNENAYDGGGAITTLNKRSFNLYSDGSNQIINFNYSTGHLTITWKFKYYQKEIVHKRDFNDVRNLSVFEQEKIANKMIEEMNIVIKRHKQNVFSI